MSRAIARNPEVVIVSNPMKPFPLFEERAMKGRKRKGRKTAHNRRGHRRHHAYNRRRHARKHAYNRRRRACGANRVCRRKRRPSAYAKFAKAMWRSHRAAYKRLGFKKAGKAIGAAWRKRQG